MELYRGSCRVDQVVGEVVLSRSSLTGDHSRGGSFEGRLPFTSSAMETKRGTEAFDAIFCHAG